MAPPTLPFLLFPLHSLQKYGEGLKSRRVFFHKPFPLIRQLILQRGRNILVPQSQVYLILFNLLIFLASPGPAQLCWNPGPAALGRMVLLGINTWLKTTEQFSTSHHSLILSPSGSSPLCTPHSVAPTTKEGKDGGGSSASFDLHPKHSRDASKTPFPCPTAAWRGFTRQNVLEKDQSGAPKCVGMNKKKVNQGMAS